MNDNNGGFHVIKTNNCIDVDRIPQERIEAMARPALEAVRKAFEDPKVVKEFNQWLAQRAKKGAHA